MRNQVILVDKKDQVIGMASKEAAHKEPLLHRAFSVFLYDDNQMLVQRRALDKYHSGGLWANTCCSHPKLSETIMEGATNRLQEEAGIQCKLRPLFEFTYLHEFAPDLYEHEYDHVLLGKYSGDYKANPEEISEMKWISFVELEKNMEQNPEQFAPWFLIAAPKVIAAIRKGIKLE